EFFTLFRLQRFDAEKAGKDRYFMEQPNNSGSPRQHIILRSSIHTHLCRIHSICPSQGELFYLRAILQTHACRSFLDARTINGEILPLYQDAANALGLFADTNEAMYAVMEGVQSLHTPRQLHILFVHLL
ncbi:hypothetical protein C8F01DRAFT_1098055, partial [Mycena amicta]